MKYVQASLLSGEILKGRYWMNQLQRERPNYCWKVVFPEALIDICLGKLKKDFFKIKSIQQQSNKRNPTKKVMLFQKEYM